MIKKKEEKGDKYKQLYFIGGFDKLSKGIN